MNVWIENPFDNLPMEGYRPQRYWMMAEAFVAAGHAVTYFTGDFSHAHKRRRDFVRNDPCGKFRLLVMPTLPYRRNVSLARIRSHRQYARTFFAFATDEIARQNRPDVLVASMPPLATCDVAGEIRRLTGCRLVFDLQDAWPETFLRLFPVGTKWFGNCLLTPLRSTARRAYRSADLVTGVAESYASLVRSYGGADCKIYPLGIRLSEREALAASPRVDGHPPSALVYAGSLGRGYDLGTVIRAVRDLPKATLDIAGSGERESEWRRLAKGCDRIRFHGYLSQEELLVLFGRCSIGVIPMRDDSCVGVPNKLADYAASGLKTIASLGGECAELIRRCRTGAQYAWGDVDSCREAIKRTADLTPDFAPIRERIDADHIYPAYVREIEALCAGEVRR